jgi:hypothetical protein
MTTATQDAQKTHGARMANPGRIVAEIGKALGKAVIAGVGLELARVATRAIRTRLGDADERRGDDDERAHANVANKTTPKKKDGDDDAAALRRENAALREELEKLRREQDAGRRPQ